MKNFWLTLIFCAVSKLLFGQDSTDSLQDGKIYKKDSMQTIGFLAFVDNYYAFSFNWPTIRNIPYAFNHNRHNEFNINLALLKFSYESAVVRANIGLQTGTYPEANYAAEPPLYRFIHEANAGVRLGEKWWFDMGIMPSHIGFESAISTENFTLTRSLAAENTPYFETGAKLSYSPNNKWFFALLALNGWQNIRETNNGKAVGTQLTFTPNRFHSFNSSTFFGNETNRLNARQLRFLHNFYWIFNHYGTLHFIVGYDVGAEERSQSGKLNFWHNPTLILRKTFFEQPYALALRTEYYRNIGGNIIIQPPYQVNFEAFGFSVNFDYQPNTNIWFRLEAKQFVSANPIFNSFAGLSKYNHVLTASLAFSFEQIRQSKRNIWFQHAD